MSNYYLCDCCESKVIDYVFDSCLCRAHGMERMRKRVMVDYHGKGGKRYDEPTDVCADFKRREDA